MDPRIVVNGLTGERIVFGDYGTEDGMDYLDIAEVTLEPGEQGPPPHAHLLGDEEFEVIAVSSASASTVRSTPSRWQRG